ncbi:MAG: colanic acid biosynthesis acetyltransferase WcaF [Chitinophagaceae bacterium]|nr:WcaF family extracellular polysaccharide biosynthesis acetyltransferase [Bacteroidota bacterium]MCC6258570.1 colanic acid biosynthesis acetyltransferase WcaF [Chitinophagaceae bacterium]
MQVDLSRYNNSWYQPAPVWKRALWYLVNVIFFQSSLCPFYRPKRFLLRCFGAKLGRRVVLKQHVNIKYPWFLSIGDNSWIGERVWIDNLGTVIIGNNVCISQDALLLCGNHDFTSPGFDLRVGEIILEEGVWIGARSIVGGGTICKSHSVLSAGSLVSGEMEPYGVYRGNPAIKIKERIIKS